MDVRSTFLTIFFVGATLVAGCTQLTAERPLFSPADQIGPPPITAGIWLSVGEDECPERNARRRSGFDRGCAPLEIRRLEDGAWEAHFRADLAPRMPARERAEMAMEEPIRFVVVSAMNRQTPDAYAPLYVAETYANETTSYFTLAPIGQMPATRVLWTPIYCDAALLDGPIEGIAVTYRPMVEEESAAAIDPGMKQSPAPHQETSRSEIESCMASTQEAVREAARRAFVEAGASNERSRLVFIRPLDR
jgi:hypothetical protein